MFQSIRGGFDVLRAQRARTKTWGPVRQASGPIVRSQSLTGRESRGAIWPNPRNGNPKFSAVHQFGKTATVARLSKIPARLMFTADRVIELKRRRGSSGSWRRSGGWWRALGAAGARQLAQGPASAASGCADGKPKKKRRQSPSIRAGIRCVARMGTAGKARVWVFSKAATLAQRLSLGRH